jgi:integrase/recombinase XerD
MTALHKAVDDYLALRRSLGTELAEAGRVLPRFVEFLEDQGAGHVTRELALRWATSASVTPATWAARLGHVRRFASWLSSIDSRTEVPPAGLLPYRIHRKPPYIYSDDDIERLVQAAARLPSSSGRRAPGGMRGLAFSTLYGLLAATGMRVSEALALDDEDVDLRAGILRIRRTKFGKSRFIPMHESTRRALARYVRRRDELLPRRRTAAFLVSDRGRRLDGCAARYNFAKVSRQVGLRRPAGGYRHGRGPRIHDMRHRFAARRLIEWYRAGLDVEREIPRLATYLGHVHVNETYWYLQAVPELLKLATERLERSRQGGKP